MSIQFSKLLPAMAIIGITLQGTPVLAQGLVNGGTYSPPVSNYTPPVSNYTPPLGNYNCPPANYQGRVPYIPAGMTIPVTLSTAISTDVAKSGDMVEGKLASNLNLEQGVIPAGTTIVGNITAAKSGGFLGRAGMLTVKFNLLRLPSGQEVPMSTHIIGGIGKYTQTGNGSDTVAGEDWKNKVGQTVGRGAIGAGVGAALGTAVGAIAGAGIRQPWWMGGRTEAAAGAGRGAWSGAAIGGGVGVADGLLLRKGKNVVISSGTPLQLQLDAPVQLSQNYQPGAF